MDGKLVVTIELGNDAMQTPKDVAEALRELATTIEGKEAGNHSGTILDDNGNTSGSWELEVEEEEEDDEPF